MVKFDLKKLKCLECGDELEISFTDKYYGYIFVCKSCNKHHFINNDNSLQGMEG